jgi:hypothetical protein
MDEDGRDGAGAGEGTLTPRTNTHAHARTRSRTHLRTHARARIYTPTGSALDFATYEDYLDSQISAVDMFYLEDEDLARDLVELGCTLGHPHARTRERTHALPADNRSRNRASSAATRGIGIG